MQFLKDIFSSDWQEKLLRDAKKSAPKEGEHGRPSPHATSLDQNETKYKNEANRLVQKARNTAFSAIQRLGDRLIRQQNILQEVRSATESRSNLNSIKMDASSILGEGKDTFKDAWKARIECSGRFNAFKATNNVQKEPDHPEDKLNYLSWVLIILVVEGFFNAIFWEAKAGSFLGGYAWAVFFAFLNIAVAFMFGLGFRYKNLGGAREKIFGWGCLMMAGYAVFRISTWIATQRANDQPAGEAVESFFTRAIPADINMAFSTIPSVFLFALTILAAIYACYKGYGFFGSIPGYSSVADDFKRASDRVDEIRSSMLRAGRGLFDSALSNLESAMTKLKDVKTHSNSARSDFLIIQSEFQTTADQIFSGYTNIIKTYRLTNLASRPENVPGPSYWGDPIEMDLDEPDNLQAQISMADGIVQEAEAMTRDLVPILDSEKQNIQIARSDFLDNTWVGYIDNCKSEAQREFEAQILFVNTGTEV